MANVYVRSAAVGTGTGADWTNAFTTLAAAFTAKLAGDIFWVADDHAETQATAMTLTSPGTAASPCFIYCVNRAGSVPPVSADLLTTATISTTGGSGITIAGVWGECYGITFNSADSTNAGSIFFGNSARASMRLTNCALVLRGSGSGAIISVATLISSGNLISWNNTTVSFANAGQSIRIAGYLQWRNTVSALLGAAVPTTLFTWIGSEGGTAILEAVDLSAAGSGKTIVGANAVPSGGSSVTLKDCKLGASVTVSSTPTGQGDFSVNYSRCDSGATNYQHGRINYAGSETVETTIVRTGGASDGTTTIAKKIITTANSKWVLPFEAIPIAIWNDVSGSAVTLTLFGIWGGGAVPNNDDIWMDVEYLGASANPQGSFISASKADNLATGSALTTDTSTWGGSTTKFKMSVTFTPQQKGAVYVYVKAAKVSSTFYIDPKPILT